MWLQGLQSHQSVLIEHKRIKKKKRSTHATHFIVHMHAHFIWLLGCINTGSFLNNKVDNSLQMDEASFPANPRTSATERRFGPSTAIEQIPVLSKSLCLLNEMLEQQLRRNETGDEKHQPRLMKPALVLSHCWVVRQTTDIPADKNTLSLWCQICFLCYY